MNLGVEIAYLIASVLFILGLRGLSSAKTARRGMNLAALGMLLAVVGFLTDRPEFLDIGLTYGFLNLIGTLAVLKFFRHGDLAYDADDKTS